MNFLKKLTTNAHIKTLREIEAEHKADVDRVHAIANRRETIKAAIQLATEAFCNDPNDKSADGYIAACLRENEFGPINSLKGIGADVVNSKFVTKVREPLKDDLESLIVSLTVEQEKLDV